MAGATADVAFGTSVLDNTVLLSAKDISEGVTHGYRNVPNVILGGRGLFKPGYFDLQNRKTSGDLFATIAQALGFGDVTTFGDPDYFTGPITEIRVRSAPLFGFACFAGDLRVELGGTPPRN